MRLDTTLVFFSSLEKLPESQVQADFRSNRFTFSMRSCCRADPVFRRVAFRVDIWANVCQSPGSGRWCLNLQCGVPRELVSHEQVVGDWTLTDDWLSAFMTLVIILLHVFWGIIFFDGCEKKKWSALLVVLLSHLLVSALVSIATMLTLCFVTQVPISKMVDCVPDSMTYVLVVKWRNSKKLLIEWMSEWKINKSSKSSYRKKQLLICWLISLKIFFYVSFFYGYNQTWSSLVLRLCYVTHLKQFPWNLNPFNM